MRCQQILLLLLSVFLLPAFALSVPFQVYVNPNGMIVADYQFGQYPLIFCFINSTQTTAGTISWFYQNSVRSAPMPITLTRLASYTGSFADTTGQISIVNTLPTQELVSCDFAF
ncbi:MAG TPA: hypothetical protein VNC84_01625 [Gammaproteobacteria bacterium]|jgi:hypothetical protein|nr:hypothetical protein [Gammaproteobacteria bacterium]